MMEPPRFGYDDADSEEGDGLGLLQDLVRVTVINMLLTLWYGHGHKNLNKKTHISLWNQKLRHLFSSSALKGLTELGSVGSVNFVFKLLKTKTSSINSRY